MAADAISLVGYVLIALGATELLLTSISLLLAARCPHRTWQPLLIFSITSPSEVEMEVDGRQQQKQQEQRPQARQARQQTVVTWAICNVLAAALVAVGNIMVYRVVLAEQLLGVVLSWGHGPVAVITTVLILCSLLHLLTENLVLLGRASVPQRPAAFAARSLGSLCVIFLILFGKLGMGIVYYADPLVLWRCRAPDAANQTRSSL